MINITPPGKGRRGIAQSLVSIRAVLSPSVQRHRECRAISLSLEKDKRNGRRDESATMENQFVPVGGVCNPVEGFSSLRFSPLQMAKTGNVTVAKDPQGRDSSGSVSLKDRDARIKNAIRTMIPQAISDFSLRQSGKDQTCISERPTGIRPIKADTPKRVLMENRKSPQMADSTTPPRL